MSESEAKAASRADMANHLRDHYERVSTIAMDWSSGIPQAIAAWEREPALRTELEAVKAEKAIDREAEGVQMLYEERVLADERHKLEDARKEAEQKRWEAEDAIPPIEHATDEVRHQDRKSVV